MFCKLERVNKIFNHYFSLRLKNYEMITNTFVGSVLT